MLHLTRLVTHEVFELADLAFPDACIVGYCLLLHDDYVLGVAELLLKVEHPNKVSDHGDLLLSRCLDSDLLDPVKGVAHNGDEQIHEKKLRNESSKKEEEPDQGSPFACKVVHTELAQSDKI